MEDSHSSEVSARRAETRRRRESGIGEEEGDASSATDLFVEVFEEVGGAEAEAVFCEEGEDGEGFGDVGLELGGEVRCGGLVVLGEGAEFGVGLGP